MGITEVRIELVPPLGDQLRAFCSVTFDDSFVVRDLKIIEGKRGVFVAMPSRKLTARCARCSHKNHCQARYCNDCGKRLPGRAAESGPDGRAKLHADIAHPIKSTCREMIQERLLEVYEEELDRLREPGYRPMKPDVADDDGIHDGAPVAEEAGDMAADAG